MTTATAEQVSGRKRRHNYESESEISSSRFSDHADDCSYFTELNQRRNFIGRSSSPSPSISGDISVESHEYYFDERRRFNPKYQSHNKGQNICRNKRKKLTLSNNQFFPFDLHSSENHQLFRSKSVTPSIPPSSSPNQILPNHLNLSTKVIKASPNTVIDTDDLSIHHSIDAAYDHDDKADVVDHFSITPSPAIHTTSPIVQDTRKIENEQLPPNEDIQSNKDKRAAAANAKLCRFSELPLEWWERSPACKMAKSEHLDRLDSLCESRELLVHLTTLWKDDIVLEPNMFPYSTPVGIEHYTLWSKEDLTHDQILYFVDKWLRKHHPNVRRWQYDDNSGERSIDIFHVHVFIEMDPFSFEPREGEEYRPPHMA